MRSASKERLQKMHALLDKQLQQETQNPYSSQLSSQRRKQRSDFQHLRYTNHLNIAQEQYFDSKDNSKNNYRSAYQKSSSESNQKQSIFKKSLQKNQKFQKELKQVKLSNKEYSESSDDLEQKRSVNSQSKNSLNGSRKCQINDLQKKLLDLQKKMENIGLSSSQQDSQQRPSPQPKAKIKPNVNYPPINQNKFSNKLFNTKQTPNNLKQQQQQLKAQGTARFHFSKQDKQILTNKQKIQKIDNFDYESNLPLSHRQKTVQQDSNSQDQYELKYQKFAKIKKSQIQQINPNSKQKQIQSNLNHQQSSEQQDSSDEFYQKDKSDNTSNNTSLIKQIKKLSILNNPNELLSITSNAVTKQINSLKVQKSEKNNRIKIDSIPFPSTKHQFQHEGLEPKVKLLSKEKDSKNDLQNKRSKKKSEKKLLKHKAKSQKSIKPLLGKHTLSIENRQNIHEIRNHSNKKNIIARNSSKDNHNQLANKSFRSDKSIKSKKSDVLSLRSIGSNKSFTNKQDIKQVDSLKQKKLTKKIQNLQRELHHYKLLNKKYQSQMNDFKFLELQYRKLEIQFKKSQQIRFQQKKIIESFRGKNLLN